MYAIDELEKMTKAHQLDESVNTLEKLYAIWNPDYIAPLGAPTEEIEDRVNHAVDHMRNFKQNENDLANLDFIAPEEEAKEIDNRLRPEEKQEIDVVSTPGHGSRWDEVKELKKHLEPEDEVHFFTSDYSQAQDKYIIRHTIPKIDDKYFPVQTEDHMFKEIESRLRKAVRVAEHEFGFYVK